MPLFVVDPGLPGHPNRRRFLGECLADLRESLRERGGDLVVRHGDPVTEAARMAREVDATTLTVADDVSRYAAARNRRLAEACGTHRWSLRVCDGVTVVRPEP